jgi:hypothetical protein
MYFVFENHIYIYISKYIYMYIWLVTRLIISRVVFTGVCLLRKKMSLPFNFPSNICLYGATQSGKTTFVLRLIKHADVMFTAIPTRILFCYGAWQPAYEQLAKLDGITMHENVPTRATIEEFSYDKKPTLLILDDLLAAIVSNSEVHHYVTVMSHHNNMTIIMLMQTIFPKGTYARTISLNCHYMVLFSNKRDSNQVKVLGTQLMPGRTKYFMDSYKKATTPSWGYLVIDIHPRSDPIYELHTRIFPDDGPLSLCRPYPLSI